MIFRNSVKIAVIAALLAVICVSAHAAGNSSGYAWNENAGWSDFNPTGAGVTVYADHLEGYAWNENIGWIRLGTFTAGTAHTYANGASAADYGVNNNGTGTLSGYGWSENAGWVNFKPTGGGVTIDGSGNFSGYSWGENIGWINFANTTPAYKVVTTFTAAPTASVVLSSLGSITGSTVVAYGTATGTGITERGFYWWIPPSPETHFGGSESGLIPEGGSGAGSFSLRLTDLKPGNTYHVKAYIKIGGQIITSDEQIFTTATTGRTAPTVITTACTLNTDGTVSATGEITDIGSSAVNVYGFVYAKHTAPYTGDNMYATGDRASAMWEKTPLYQGLTFAKTIGNLIPGKWYLRAYAHNDNPDSDAAQTASLGYGEDCTFTVACTPETCLPGDVNGDGRVSLDDAMLAVRILAGIPVGNVNIYADVNGDGKIGLAELGYILQKVAGLR